MDILKKLQEELNIKASQVENTVKLLDEGNTVPFIARYRKEMTGSLDDQIIRQLSERLTALRNLEEKREQVRNAIAALAKARKIIVRPTSLHTVVTICNYEDYVI